MFPTSLTADTRNEIAENEQFTDLHRISNKLAALVERAPAGGIFTATAIGPVITDDGFRSHFEMFVPFGGSLEGGTFRVTVEKI